MLQTHLPITARFSGAGGAAVPPAAEYSVERTALSLTAQRVLVTLPRTPTGAAILSQKDASVTVQHGQNLEEAINAHLEQLYATGGRVLQMRLCTIPEALVAEAGDQAEWACLDDDQISFVEYASKAHAGVLEEFKLSPPAVTSPIPRHLVALPPGMSPECAARALDMPSCRKALADAARVAADMDQLAVLRTRARLAEDFEKFRRTISEKLLEAEEGFATDEQRFADLKAWAQKKHGKAADNLQPHSAQAEEYLDQLRAELFASVEHLKRAKRIRLFEMEQVLPPEMRNISRRMDMPVDTEPLTDLPTEAQAALSAIARCAPQGANVAAFVRTCRLVHKGDVVAQLQRPFVRMAVRYRSILFTRELALD